DPTPSAPVVTGETGWRFVGWVPEPSATVTGNAVYVAQWEQEMFTVRFVNWDNTLLKEERVAYGGSATAPANPTRTGYTFTGWSHTFNYIVSDLTVTAQYRQNDNTGTTPGGPSSPSTPPSTKPPTTPTPPPETSPSSPPTEVPPDGGEEEPLAVWALVNLLLSVTGVILAIIIIIYTLLQKKQKQKIQQKNAKNQNETKFNNEQSGDNDKQRRNIWLFTAIALGIAGLIVFILTEDMTRPMALVDKWTIVNAIIFIVEIIAIALIFKRKKNNEEKVAYTVHYCLQGTTTHVGLGKTSGFGPVGLAVTEIAPDIVGYAVTGKSMVSLTLAEDASKNVITFYYVPNGNAEN
ncbi:InlB B-repeat-containing protein, partial [Candidatus Bathycorpusculum sp.]|uniref:InlB B-repeat-containing protein n=1 Tax=Candidatus Bathycorpusculum sp. TaxID=2994959 RepID=UPI002837483F|nr:InlB B-repeat-containing protein [Candidatus Termitimicrobium sp.]MCL2686855.1 InlB B-repeat-containing protein [Candidatus Termitimicrobium sp.]